MKKILYILKISLILFLLIVLFISLLCISASIPTSLIKENISESIYIFDKEGYFPKEGFNFLLDNWTDALMLNMSYSVNSERPFESIMLNRMNYEANANLEYSDNAFLGPIEHLKETMEGKQTHYYEYARYWHGYLVYLRPLLAITNYLGVRIFLSVLIFSLSFYLIYLSYKIDKKLGLSLGIWLISIPIYFIGLSIQYSSVIIITLIASVVILKNKKIDINILFLVIGAFTSFMDLLTTPILTFGIPIFISIYLNSGNIKEKINLIIKLGLFWSLGYLGIWAMKWLIVDVIYNKGIIKDAISTIIYRTIGNEKENGNIIETILLNILYYKKIIVLLLLSYFSFVKTKRILKENIPYMIIGIIPFIWYSIVNNHSYIHARFTYKNLTITFLCLFIIIINNYLYIKKEKNRIK